MKYAINFISTNTFPMGKKISYGINWRASEGSETLSGVTQSRFRYIYWRASEASETLSGVTQSRFRYIYLFIYLFIYMVRRTSFFARASNYVLVKRF